jgi:hypothetical protein
MMTENDVIRAIVKWCMGAIQMYDKDPGRDIIGNTMAYQIEYDEWMPIVEYLLENGYKNIPRFIEKHAGNFSIFNLSTMKSGSNAPSPLVNAERGDRDYALEFDPIKTLTSTPKISIWLY